MDPLPDSNAGQPASPEQVRAALDAKIEALVRERLFALTKTYLGRIAMTLGAAGVGVGADRAVTSFVSPAPDVVEPVKVTPVPPACKCQPAPKGQTITALQPK
jgi:hypothetical protein